MITFVDCCVKQSLPADVIERALSNFVERAHMFVDTLLKSTVEFWKAWSMLLPLLSDCEVVAGQGTGAKMDGAAGGDGTQ